MKQLPTGRVATALSLIGLALVVATTAACGAGPRPTATVALKRYAAPPPMTIDPHKQYTAIVRTTLGDITIQLNAKDAPTSVNNFVFLARDGFYNNVPFHRVIRGFMIQTGDPTGTGAGGPGYKFADEPVKGSYEVGSVAMANSGPNTNGSQFFICDGDQCKTLPPKYNLFGQVVAGIDVVHQIANVQVTTGSDGNPSKPLQEVRIRSIEIRES